MAENLLRAGFPLIVHNRSSGPVEELSRQGAQVALSPDEVARHSDITITMLPDSPQVVEVMSGVLAGAARGHVVIDMSTIAPAVTRELAGRAAEAGVELLDAPVSGGDIGARDGTLSIMVGGSKTAFDRVRPVLEALGTTITRVGDSGAGQVVKACNQVVVALTIEAVSEALVLGSKAGVDPAVIIRVLSGGLAANKVMEVRGRNLLEHDFTPGFKVALHHKDLGIALTTAREAGAVLPLTATVDQLLAALGQRGCGGEDHSALLRISEELSNHRIGTTSVEAAA